jgi:hypothetical protein
MVGGVKASFRNDSIGIIDNWIRQKMLTDCNYNYLDSIVDNEQRL